MKADKLIEDANELLMQLRIKSEKETINEKQLYDVQMLLYKALDKLRQPNVSGSLPTMQEIKTSLYKCAKVTIESDGVKMERLFEKEAKAMLALFGGNDH